MAIEDRAVFESTITLGDVIKIAEHEFQTLLGKEFSDIIVAAGITCMPMDQLNVAILGRVGVSASRDA